MSSIDTDNNLFSIFAELKLHLGGIADSVKESVSWQKRAKRYDTPISTKRPYSLVMPATGLGVVSLGGPAQGRVWNIRSWTVAGTDPSTSITGRADVYITGASINGPITLASLGTTDWRDYSPSIPNVAFYGVGEMRVLAGEKVLFVFSTVAANTNLSGSALIEDFEDASLTVRMEV